MNFRYSQGILMCGISCWQEIQVIGIIDCARYWRVSWLKRNKLCVVPYMAAVTSIELQSDCSKSDWERGAIIWEHLGLREGIWRPFFFPKIEEQKIKAIWISNSTEIPTVYVNITGSATGFMLYFLYNFPTHPFRSKKHLKKYALITRSNPCRPSHSVSLISVWLSPKLLRVGDFH